MPWPPSINHYYIRSRLGVVIGARGKDYRRNASFELRHLKGACGNAWVKMEIHAHPPDNRRRDLDNLLKCCIDSIQYAGIISDDYQINFLSIERKSAVKGGRLHIWISEC